LAREGAVALLLAAMDLLEPHEVNIYVLLF
jgi:hypothetical protein